MDVQLALKTPLTFFGPNSVVIPCRKAPGEGTVEADATLFIPHNLVLWANRFLSRFV